MIRETASHLPKLGERVYIQGVTILNGIVSACDAAFGASWRDGAKITSFKAEREATANGRIIVSDAAIAGVDPNSIFVAHGPSGDVHGCFVDEGAPFEREDYDEDSFYRVVSMDQELRGSFRLPSSRPGSDFIKGIIGANKRLHQEATAFRAGLTQIQFLYLRGLDAACLAEARNEWSVEIEALSKKETDTEAWTISRVVVTHDAGAAQFRLCYRAQKLG